MVAVRNGRCMSFVNFERPYQDGHFINMGLQSDFLGDWRLQSLRGWTNLIRLEFLSRSSPQMSDL